MFQKHEDKATRQKQIVEATRKIIDRLGSDQVTIKRIAREVGVTEGAIYRHFQSKKDILLLLLDDIEKIWLREVGKKTEIQGLSPLQALDIILRSHFSGIEKRRGIAFRVVAGIISLGDKKLNSKVDEIIAKYISCFKDLLSDGVQSGEVRPETDLDAAATLLFSMIQGVVNIWALSNYSFNPEDRYLPMWNIYRKAIGAERN